MGFLRLCRKGSVLISQGAFRPKGQTLKNKIGLSTANRSDRQQRHSTNQSLLGILEWFGKETKNKKEKPWKAERGGKEFKQKVRIREK